LRAIDWNVDSTLACQLEDGSFWPGGSDCPDYDGVFMISNLAELTTTGATRKDKNMLERPWTHLPVRTILASIVAACSAISAAIPASAESESRLPSPHGLLNVKDYGAAADGKTKDTEAIGKAIHACAEAGGGTVYFPAGTYLTGPIRLQSNITLHIAPGATLLFSDDFDDYPTEIVRWGSGVLCHGYSPLIYGYRVNNVAIVGRGTINGQGGKWWKAFAAKRHKDYQPTTKREKEFAALNKGLQGSGQWLTQFLRPTLMEFIECENILIEGVTLRNSPLWNIHPVFCKTVTIHNVTILAPHDSPNTDGIDIDSSRDVHVSNCHIDCGDDCIVLKSGEDEDGRRVGIPTETVAITNCTMNRTTGLVFGSEMSGGIRNVTVANCAFQNSVRGIEFRTRRGRGGVVENIAINNIAMENVKSVMKINVSYRAIWDKKDDAIAYPVTEGTPRIRNVIIDNIIASGSESAGTLFGLPEMPPKGITLSNIRISAIKGLRCAHMDDIEFHNVRITSEIGSSLFCENVSNLELDGFKTVTPQREHPDIKLMDVRGVYVHDCSPGPAASPFVEIGGGSTEGVVFMSNNVPSAREVVSRSEEVSEGVLQGATAR